MILGLAPVDVAVIILYLVGITYIGLRSSRSVKTSGDFFMGGRRFGKLSMIAKAFGVGTRVDHVVAVTGASYEVGLSGVWYQWLYIFSTPFFWIIAPIYRRLRYVTTGDFFEERYGTRLPPRIRSGRCSSRSKSA
jgi:Na+/proline symporter